MLGVLKFPLKRDVNNSLSIIIEEDDFKNLVHSSIPNKYFVKDYEIGVHVILARGYPRAKDVLGKLFLDSIDQITLLHHL